MTEAEFTPPAGRVSEIATRCLLTVGEKESLWKAKDLMKDERASRLVVLGAHDRPLGVVSKRDIARFLFGDLTKRGLKDIGVGEACAYPVHMIRSESSVSEAAQVFDTKNLSCALVSEDDEVSGIVTETDLCQHFSLDSSAKFKVGDFMTTDFFFAKTNYPVVHVAHALVFRQPTVPVIDEKLVGILTLTDILSMNENELVSSEPDRAILMASKDLMTRSPITTFEETKLTEAAKAIVSNRKNSLPVIDHKSRVVGLLTKHDLVKAMASLRSLLPTEIGNGGVA
jgi:CBS domain-containing protein